MSLQVFRRASAAFKIARAIGAEIITVRSDGQTIYIVGSPETDASIDEIAVLTPKTTMISGVEHHGFEYAGQVNRGHLKRLGNANWAKSPTEIEAMKPLVQVA
jgi:hypothetical protein